METHRRRILDGMFPFETVIEVSETRAEVGLATASSRPHLTADGWKQVRDYVAKGWKKALVA